MISTRLGDLHVRTVGTGASTTVMWPSMFVDSHTWDLLLPYLPEDRRYVLVDGPGVGLSQALGRESNISEAAEAAIDLLRGLKITEPVDWVGNAFGGHVGFKLAARPGILRSLVAISSPSEPLPHALRRKIAMLGPVVRLVGTVAPIRSAVLAAMLTDASAGDARVRQIVLDGLARPGRRSLSYAIKSFILNRVDVTPELRDILVPSLFVASDSRGEWTPEDAQKAAALTPGAAVLTVRGARTLIPLEQPEILARHLRAFWAKLMQTS